MITRYANNLYDKLFTEIQWPFISLLRIFLVLISLKEVHAMKMKFALHFQNEQLFQIENFYTNFLSEILSSHYQSVLYLTYLLGFLAVIGLFTRPALALYSLLYFSLIYFDFSFGIYNHESGLTVQILFILIFAPGIKNWSIDGILSSGNGINSFFTTQKYTDWAVKLVLLLMVLGYVTAGISKIRYGGLAWLSGDTLSYYLSGGASHENDIAQKFIRSPQALWDWKQEFSLVAYSYGNFQTNTFFRELALTMSNSHFTMMTLAIMTVILELGAVFMLFFKGFRNLFLLSAVAFHFSIRILMGLGFLDYQIICLCMVDWDYLYSSVKNVQLKGKK
jgi:uncharacterized membrane protein YphA (DoxX/SURF4 family)